jgi:hypothetical protein
MTLNDATILASELILTIIVGFVVGRALSRMLVRRLRTYGLSGCRLTDTQRAHTTHETAEQVYREARDVRLAAEALENHLKGAAHV